MVCQLVSIGVGNQRMTIQSHGTAYPDVSGVASISLIVILTFSEDV